jgi:hypothetical protein
MVERNFSKPRRLDPERRRRKKEGEKTVAERMKEAYMKQGGGRDPMAA